MGVRRDTNLERMGIRIMAIHKDMVAIHRDTAIHKDRIIIRNKEDSI